MRLQQVKANSDIFADILYDVFNRSLEVDTFPSSMKLANLTSVYEKGSRSDKDNYRPVNILQNLWKSFERCVYKQMSKLFDEILSKYQCGFRKGHDAQHCLTGLLERWCVSIDQGLEFGAQLIDLLKAFDCLLHNLLPAKLSAYGFDMKALRFIDEYLQYRKQTIKISNTYSPWEEILYGVIQGSILGLLLFNIDLCYLFVIMDEHEVLFMQMVIHVIYLEKTLMRLLNRRNIISYFSIV